MCRSASCSSVVPDPAELGAIHVRDVVPAGYVDRIHQCIGSVLDVAPRKSVIVVPVLNETLAYVSETKRVTALVPDHREEIDELEFECPAVTPVPAVAADYGGRRSR